MMAIRRAIWFTILMAVKLVVLYVRVVRFVLRRVGRVFGLIGLWREVGGVIGGYSKRCRERCFDLLVWILLGVPVRRDKSSSSSLATAEEEVDRAEQVDMSTITMHSTQAPPKEQAILEAVSDDSIPALELIVKQEHTNTSTAKPLVPIQEASAPCGLLIRPSKAYLRHSYTRHCSLELELPRIATTAPERKLSSGRRSHRRHRSCGLWWPKPFHPDEKGGLYGTYAVGT